MSRYLIFFLALNIQGFASIAYASNDLDKWNSEKGKLIRSELKSKLTTTYTEKPNPLHTDSIYKASENSGKVLTKLETKAEIKGSRVGATIEALKTVDKTAVAKKWAKEFAKGGVRFAAGAVLIEVAMNEMLNGIGWIIDEGGKVTKPYDSSTASSCGPTNYSGCEYSQYLYSYQSSIQYPSASSLCASIGTGWKQGHSGYQHGCFTKDDGWTGVVFNKMQNPFYSPTALTPPGVQPQQSEIESKIKDYLNDPTKSNSVKDLIIEQAVKPTGKASIMWSDDPSSEQTIFQDNKEAAERILNSDNPQGEGLTKTTPKIDDATTLEGETTPKPNPENPTIPDPVTGEPIPNPNYDPNYDSGSSTSFSLPPFCDWASIVCDWIDWTKEMPEDEEQKEEENINDRGIFNRELDTEFTLEGQCPNDYTFVMTNKYLAGIYTIPLNWLCISFTFIGYALVFASNCLGMWILYETVTRKELKW